MPSKELQPSKEGVASAIGHDWHGLSFASSSNKMDEESIGWMEWRGFRRTVRTHSHNNNNMDDDMDYGRVSRRHAH